MNIYNFVAKNNYIMIQSRNILTVNLALPWRAVGDKVRTPVVLMTQGVRNGSMGALLWRSDILSQQPERWNGVPVVINHPQINGEFVSVHYNDETEASIIGYVRNAKYCGQSKSLKADIEVNLSSKELPTLQSLKEVSIGVFSQQKEESGVFNRVSYYAVVQSYTPDHLAILKGEVGACSWADGCGIRVNQSNKETILEAATIHFNNLIRKQFMEDIMQSNEILLPVGITVNEEDEASLDVNANFNEDVLYPPCVCRTRQASKKPDTNKKPDRYEEQDNDILMPTSIY